MKFNYNLPVNLVFGRGRVAEIGTLSAEFGKKALIVTGKSSTKNSVSHVTKTIYPPRKTIVQSNAFCGKTYSILISLRANRSMRNSGISIIQNRIS